MKNDFFDQICFFFVAISSSLKKTFFTVALTARKRSSSMFQRTGTSEGTTSRYVIVVSVYSGGVQPSPQAYPLDTLTLGPFMWLLNVVWSPVHGNHTSTIDVQHGFRGLTVPLFVDQYIGVAFMKDVLGPRLLKAIPKLIRKEAILQFPFCVNMVRVILKTKWTYDLK